jgi:hypothetical protein
VVEGDEDVEQEDPAQSVPPEGISRDTSEPILPKEELPSKVSSPKPHPLSISFQPTLPSEQDDDGLGGALQGLDDLNDPVNVVDPLDPTVTGLVDLDLTQLGADGTAFEDAGDLTQIEPTDSILGANILDAGITDDPFVMQPS